MRGSGTRIGAEDQGGEPQEESGETMSIRLAFREFGIKANKVVIAKIL